MKVSKFATHHLERIVLISALCLFLSNCVTGQGGLRDQGQTASQKSKTVEEQAAQPQPKPQPPLQGQGKPPPPTHEQQQQRQQLQRQQQHFNPQQPQQQEHQQEIHEQERRRQAVREQLLHEQQLQREQQQLNLKLQQEEIEQQKQQFKAPLHDSSINMEQENPEPSIEPIRQPVPVKDTQLPQGVHQPYDSEQEVLLSEKQRHSPFQNSEEGRDRQPAEGDSGLQGPTEINPLKSRELNRGEETKSDDSVKGSLNDFNPQPPLGMGAVPSSMAETDEGKGARGAEAGQMEMRQVPGSVVPPIVSEKELEEEADDSSTGENEETPLLYDGKEMTPEQIEAEKLFQAGEKLINATYYKEYKEAYLNFLRASEMDHKKAKEYVAFAHLFGDYLPQNVTRASELFDELADLGSPKAQMGLSFMCSAGFHYNSSQAKALIYSTFGALGGDPLAQMSLGYRYYAGVGVESKCETALTYYRKVATKVADAVTLAGGPVVQRIRLQEEAENQGTSNSPLLDDDLLQYYHFLADKGDQQAQVVLGTLYYQGGKGVQINHEQAFHYFSTAAEGGSAHAMGYLGKMHSEGSPVVKQSNHTAFEFFKKSAEKNNHIGQAGLGMMYLNGLGIEKDSSKAFRYFSLASDQGSVDGQLQLGIMYFSGNGVRKDYKMAVKYFTMASQNGHVLAFFNLAQMHATGTGVLRNCHTAVELFKNVAERGRWSEQLMDAHRMYQDGSVDTAIVKYMFLAELGYEVAQSNVAYLLDTGTTTKFSNYETHQRALLQYSRAASQGSTHARLKMGDYHYYGLGTEVDYESAASHYRMASEQQHNAQAMFNLGYMHERGLGLKQDVHLAKRFYDMAAETSIDAHIPVALALFKLGIFYGLDVFSKEFEGINSVLKLLDPVQFLGPEWDLYLASVFSLALGIIFFLRRR
ncbi:protein sel-1 homolog 1 isoform X2 [Aplysia californica]|uniref:Protein sel-1 homolog 1 isoform X2 n=1 Tax=Aplysia californica TaxID=6500 RepID=A0ABM0JNM1_APLCA|nr:protein sel-1 homolog 1 isoform X2 [Aplysia californica]